MSLCHPLCTPTEVLLMIRALSLYSEDCGKNGDLDTMVAIAKLTGMLAHEISLTDKELR